MSGKVFVRKRALPGRNFVRKGFCQEAERFLSGSGLCQEGILSGKVFVRKRALPGRDFVRKRALPGRNFVRKGFFVRKRALPGRNFVRKGFCQEAGFARKEFCQERFLSGSGLCQEGILSGRFLSGSGLCQEGILSGREEAGSARKEFCQEGFLPGSGLCQEGICQERFLSGSGLCQEGILSGKDFVRKRALPGGDFVRKGFCQEAGSARKEFCQEGILSGSGLCQEGILSGKVFVRKRALPGRNFVRKGFCKEAGSARKEFCQERFLSGSGLCQEGILSGKVFVRKRALPGRNFVRKGFSSASGCPGPPRQWRCGPRAASSGFGQLPAQRGELVAQVGRDHEVLVVPRQLLRGTLGGPADRLGVLVLQRFHGGLPGEDVHHHQVVLRLPPRVLAEVDEVGLQPVVRPLGGRLAQRARPRRLHLPAHVGLQRLEGHGLRRVEVALPRKSVQLPRVTRVEVVGQVPQRLHFKKTTLLPQKGACSRFPGCREPCTHLLVAPKRS